MKLIFTQQSLDSLEEALNFIAPKVSHEKLIKIRDKILDATDVLLINPLIGQEEPYLEHLGLQHRRIIEGHYKIIYRVSDNYIYITDIFDSRQKPEGIVSILDYLSSFTPSPSTTLQMLPEKQLRSAPSLPSPNVSFHFFEKL